jgi:hypothetical protein
MVNYFKEVKQLTIEERNDEQKETGLRAMQAGTAAHWLGCRSASPHAFGAGIEGGQTRACGLANCSTPSGCSLALDCQADPEAEPS